MPGHLDQWKENTRKVIELSLMPERLADAPMSNDAASERQDHAEQIDQLQDIQTSASKPRLPS